MATEWRIKAIELANCNCAYGCPCQFNALPTYGDCHAAVGYQIEAGHYGDVPLDGLCAGVMLRWEGPIHHGNGTMQLVIDERADPRQRDALVRIMSGEDTDEMATMWWVFGAMCPNKLEPLFKPIDVAIDVRGAATSASLTSSKWRPNRSEIPSPVANIECGSTCPMASNFALLRSAVARRLLRVLSR